MIETLIPKHGGYRNLKSFQVSQLVYDLTVRFCDRYIEKRSRTHDQMVQAARSGVQNIAEGSQASGTSKKFELKLTSVARASLEELRLDYEDFLRQKSLPLWERQDPRRQSLVDRRCATVDEVARWAQEVHSGGHGGLTGRSGHFEKTTGNVCPSTQSTTSTTSTMSTIGYPEIAANSALVLLAVACALLDRQLAALAKAFENEGGFTERLYRVRSNRRTSSSSTASTKSTASTMSKRPPRPQSPQRPLQKSTSPLSPLRPSATVVITELEEFFDEDMVFDRLHTGFLLVFLLHMHGRRSRRLTLFQVSTLLLRKSSRRSRMSRMQPTVWVCSARQAGSTTSELRHLRSKARELDDQFDTLSDMVQDIERSLKRKGRHDLLERHHERTSDLMQRMDQVREALETDALENLSETGLPKGRINKRREREKRLYSPEDDSPAKTALAPDALLGPGVEPLRRAPREAFDPDVAALFPSDKAFGLAQEKGVFRLVSFEREATFENTAPAADTVNKAVRFDLDLPLGRAALPCRRAGSAAGSHFTGCDSGHEPARCPG